VESESSPSSVSTGIVTSRPDSVDSVARTTAGPAFSTTGLTAVSANVGTLSLSVMVPIAEAFKTLEPSRTRTVNVSLCSSSVSLVVLTVMSWFCAVPLGLAGNVTVVVTRV
jgi:hypothetical protein